MADDHESFMRIALEEARKAGEAGNRAVGAVVVRNGAVIGQGGNQRESAVDPAGHAEVTALRDAARRTGSLDFRGCTLYTTLEPCPMCCGAVVANNVPALVVGVMHAPGERRWGGYTVQQMLDIVGQGTAVDSGVLGAECAALLREWDAKQGRI